MSREGNQNKIIDDLNEYSIYEMAKVGEVQSKVEVYVNSKDDGRVPHFHVWKLLSNRSHEWEVCIKFKSAEYFNHSDGYDTSLPKGMAKKLDAMLRSVNPKSKDGETYWETAINFWNLSDSRERLDWDLEQPDYTKLK